MLLKRASDIGLDINLNYYLVNEGNKKEKAPFSSSKNELKGS